MDIAIIDTRISLNYFDNVSSVESNLSFLDGKEIQEDSIPENKITHGTICASIIRTYAPFAPLHSINVFKNGVGSVDNIIAAIHYCIKRNIRIINISSGTNSINANADLEKATNLAFSNDVIIIAASSKNGIVTYPAHYNEVIGVGINPKLHLSKDMIKVNDNAHSSINVFACGIQRLYKENRLIHVTSNEPSYATAVVSALAYNVLCDRKGAKNSKAVLELLAGKEY